MTEVSSGLYRAPSRRRRGVAAWLSSALLWGGLSTASDSADAPDGLDEIGVADTDGDAQSDAAVDGSDVRIGGDPDVVSDPDGSDPDVVADAPDEPDEPDAGDDVPGDVPADPPSDAIADASDLGSDGAPDGVADAADASDVPSVCIPTGEAAHYWAGTLANRTTTTFAPDNPSAETFGPGEVFGDAILARFEDHCLDWTLRLTHAGPQRMIVDEDAEAIYFAIAAGFLSPFTIEDQAGDVQATFSQEAGDLFRAVYLARFDYDGTLRWVRRLGNSSTSHNGSTSINGMALTEAGLRIVGNAPKGGISGPTYPFTFGPGEDDEEVYTVSTTHGIGFTALFDPETGDYIGGSAEVIRLNGTTNSRELRFTGQDGGRPDTDGNLGLAGWIVSAGSWAFSAGQDDQTLVTTTTSAGFVVRYLANGDIDWLHLFGNGEESGGAFGVSTAADGSIYVAGGLEDTGTFFEDGAAGVRVAAREGGAPFFVVKYGADGVIDWTRALASEGASGTNPRLFIDDEEGALYGILAASAAVTFGIGEDSETTIPLTDDYETVLFRLDPDTGDLVWARRIHSNDRPSIGNLVLREGGFEATVAARHETRINVGQPDEVTVGNDAVWRSGLGRWSSDGALLDFTVLTEDRGVLPIFGPLSVRVANRPE